MALWVQMVGTLCCWSQFLNDPHSTFASFVLVLKGVLRGDAEERVLVGEEYACEHILKEQSGYAR